MPFPSHTRGPVSLTHRRLAAAAVIYAFSLITRGSLAMPGAGLNDPTGLPVYPNVDYARQADRLRTDDLGRWCSRLSARSSDSLATVENWYRRALSSASETDLRNDGDYARSYGDLDGIKLTMNLAFVAVYKASKGATATFIDIVRCGPVR